MEVSVLSVKNPYSYFLCAGMKDVENRTWKTDYRGTLYIHSSKGFGEFIGVPDLHEYPLPLYRELEKLFDNEKKTFHGEGEYLIFDEGEMFLKKEKASDFRILSEYHFLTSMFNASNENKVFFRESAIIGTVDLVDIVQDYDSPWSEAGNYHWIVKNPVLFEKPIRFVNGKLRIWEYDLQEVSING